MIYKYTMIIIIIIKIIKSKCGQKKKISCKNVYFFKPVKNVIYTHTQ